MNIMCIDIQVPTLAGQSFRSWSPRWRLILTWEWAHKFQELEPKFQESEVHTWEWDHEFQELEPKFQELEGNNWELAHKFLGVGA
jgi:hypothetical protein